MYVTLITLTILYKGTLSLICNAWGVTDPDLFASMQLMKPYRPDKKAVHLSTSTRAEALEMHMTAKERFRQLLGRPYD